MIPRERVAYWLALFGERMGRQLSAETFRQYAAAFDVLDLEADDFERAATALYGLERFLPPPVDFLHAAHPDRQPARRAALALHAVREARHWMPNTSGGNAAGWTVIRWADVPDDLREIAREAFNLAGGTVELLEPGKDFGFQRRFLELAADRATELMAGRLSAGSSSATRVRLGPPSVKVPALIPRAGAPDHVGA